MNTTALVFPGVPPKYENSLMSAALQELKNTVKEFVLREFLPGEDPALLDDSTPLISGGILDSLAMVKFVSFLEEHYGIELKPHEITPDRFDTIPQISAVVERKRNAAT